jgi:putative peptidoglycan lipid II flippase
VGEGAVAAIYYANRIIQFPLAIFGIAISTASLPVMSQQVARNDIDKLKTTISFSLRHIFLIMLPASTVLLLLATPITRMLFERGNFDRYSSSITSWALLFYSFGLTAYAAVKVLSSCFYSLQDTATPVKMAGLCLAVNLGLNLLLMWPLQVGGLALASSISATLNFFLLLRILEKRIGKLDIAVISNSFLRILLSSLTMGLGLQIFWQKIFLNLTGPLKLILALILAVLLFLLGSLVFQVKELKEFSRWFSKKG